MRKIKNITVYRNINHVNMAWKIRNIDSTGSPLVKGKRVLRANPFSFERSEALSYQIFGSGDYAVMFQVIGDRGLNSPASQNAKSAAYNKAYARLRGKLYEGNANLGVTLGSFQQSRRMIQTRAQTLGASIDLFASRLEKGQIKRQSLAGTYLEYIFGWKPLLKDIHAAANTVIQLADKRTSVRGSGHEYFEEVYGLSKDGDGVIRRKGTRSGQVTATVATLVTITNPNRWLAERAGLLNPFAVAWDLVPWSFVVNVFVNTGQLINSITDFAGLSFDNESTTYTCHESGQQYAWNGYPSTHPFWAKTLGVYRSTTKSRDVGTIPKPSFQFKIPEANWELAAMAGSLLVQKVRRLDRLLSVKFV